jgi:Flp pilus assembly protein TadB
VGSDVRDRLAERHQELVSRHEVLGREPEDSARYDDLLERVFDAGDDLLRVLDEAEARAARHRRLAATGLLMAGLVTAGLVAGGVLPAWALIGVVLAVAAAAVLWLTAHPRREPPGRSAVPRQRPAPADVRERQEVE